jgi:hypothetical protein
MLKGGVVEDFANLNWLERENEQKTIAELVLLDLEEENDPDWQQYANLKWKVRE